MVSELGIRVHRKLRYRSTTTSIMQQPKVSGMSGGWTHLSESSELYRSLKRQG
jgi:hypothetical protein